MTEEVKNLLEQIYNERYGEIELGSSQSWVNLEELAIELSRLVGKDKPWGKRYLYSILKYEDFNVSKKMTTALQAFAAVYFDGANPMIAQLTKKTVYSRNGNLRSGSIIMGTSVQCICGAWIVPRSWNGKYCSDDCRKEARRARRKR